MKIKNKKDLTRYIREHIQQDSFYIDEYDNFIMMLSIETEFCYDIIDGLINELADDGVVAEVVVGNKFLLYGNPKVFKEKGSSNPTLDSIFYSEV